MRAPEVGRVIVAACLLVAADSTVRADYADEVLEDEPFAYWRLGEEDAASPAENVGTALEVLDGTYAGNVQLGEESLIFEEPDPSARFDGFDAKILIPDSDLINLNGPFQAKSIELWFQAELIDTEPRVLWEEGGSTNGLTIYVQQVDGVPLFVMAARSNNQSWGPVAVSVEIEEEVTYHAVMVLDGSDDDVFGNTDGRITGYLDGEEFDTVLGVDQMGQHTGDISIGGLNGRAPLADDVTLEAGGGFQGIIDEVALYDYPLDDPDDDGDLGDSRVMDHFLAGSSGVAVECPSGLTATREGANVKLTWTPEGAATSVRVVRNGVELAAAAPVDPPEFIDTTAAPGELRYELTFNPPDDECSLSERLDVCISDLTASVSPGRTELSWVNNFPYGGIVVQRGDDVIATIGGDQVSYTDVDPPVGFWTYSVVPQNGDCARTTVDVWVFDTDYPNVVIGDGAGGYWRLGESADIVATNFGSVGSLIDGTYTGNVVLGADSLLIREPDDPAIALDGIDGQVNIPDSNFINLAGPFLAKTVELWFQAELIGPSPQILWEEGGNDDGLNMYVQEVDGSLFIFMVAWAEGGPTWGPTVVSAEIEEGRTYHAVMVFDASADDDLDTLDGRITGYLDGEEFETAGGAGPLDRHGSNVAIGGISGNTQFADGTQQASGANFQGIIDEVAVYSIALDDPDGDEDRADSRVLAHFLAGADPGDCPSGLEVQRDGDNVKLTWKPGVGETSVRVLRNGTLLAAAAPVDPPEYTDTTATAGRLVYELQFNLPSCQPLKRSFKACISDLTAMPNGVGRVDLAWVNHLAYSGIAVQRGDDVIATIGGDQVSYTDTDVPPGLHTYSVVPVDGDCDPATAEARVFDTEYPAMVLADGAFAYWRLDEEGDIALVLAANSGSAGTALDGTYIGTMVLGQDSLLDGAPDNPAIFLDGFDSYVSIPDSVLMNLTGPFPAKTIELWFQADVVDAEPRVLWEEGGGTNGLGMYVQEVVGSPQLVMTARSDNSGWASISVSAEIEAGVTYHAVMVLDGSDDEEVGNFDGRITGYLDGEEFETAFGADLMGAHTGDSAIGGVNGAMSLADGTTLNSGGFAGTIDDVSLYEIALDDPNDDGDLTDSRVMDHFRAGSGSGGPDRPVFHRGDTNGDGTINITDAVGTLGFLFSGGEDTTCKETQDFDNDGSIVLTDAVGILSFLFSSGADPAPPGPASQPCGPDPDDPGTPGDLGCDSYGGC